MPFFLRISEDYLSRELEQKGDCVWEWIEDYCLRNKIPCYLMSNKEHFVPLSLQLEFRSYHQLMCFVRLGNRKYPHFEFL